MPRHAMTWRTAEPRERRCPRSCSGLQQQRSIHADAKPEPGAEAAFLRPAHAQSARRSGAPLAPVTRPQRCCCSGDKVARATDAVNTMISIFRKFESARRVSLLGFGAGNEVAARVACCWCLRQPLAALMVRMLTWARLGGSSGQNWQPSARHREPEASAKERLYSC